MQTKRFKKTKPKKPTNFWRSDNQRIQASALPMTESEIRNNLDWIDWKTICKHQRLSEEFIKEFKNEIDWPTIHQYQLHLSDKFKREFSNEHN